MRPEACSKYVRAEQPAWDLCATVGFTRLGTVCEESCQSFETPIWLVLKLKIPFRILYIPVSPPLAFLKRGPNLENYRYGRLLGYGCSEVYQG